MPGPEGLWLWAGYFPESQAFVYMMGTPRGPIASAAVGLNETVHGKHHGTVPGTWQALITGTLSHVCAEPCVHWQDLCLCMLMGVPLSVRIFVPMSVCICLHTRVCVFTRAWPGLPALLWPRLSSVGGQVSPHTLPKKAEAWEGLGWTGCPRSSQCDS